MRSRLSSERWLFTVLTLIASAVTLIVIIWLVFINFKGIECPFLNHTLFGLLSLLEIVKFLVKIYVSKLLKILYAFFMQPKTLSLIGLRLRRGNNFDVKKCEGYQSLILNEARDSQS